MFTLEIENENKSKLKLTQDESIYQVVNVEGFTPPKAEIVTIDVANMDGQRFKSSRLDVRNIVLTIQINGDVETNRIKLYDFFDCGQKSKIYYSNGSRKVYIDGYTENFECELFSNSQSAQISIICPEPHWKSLYSIFVDISQSFGAFEFPFAIESEGIEFETFIDKREVNVVNEGDSSCGLIITLTALGDEIINPTIWNVKTQEFMSLNLTLNVGDYVVINTNKGSKSIFKFENGVRTNVISSLKNGSSWLQLGKGINTFTYDGDANYSQLQVYLEFNNLYKGV